MWGLSRISGFLSPAASVWLCVYGAVWFIGEVFRVYSQDTTRLHHDLDQIRMTNLWMNNVLLNTVAVVYLWHIYCFQSHHGYKNHTDRWQIKWKNGHGLLQDSHTPVHRGQGLMEWFDDIHCMLQPSQLNMYGRFWSDVCEMWQRFPSANHQPRVFQYFLKDRCSSWHYSSIDLYRRLNTKEVLKLWFFSL